MAERRTRRRFTAEFKAQAVKRVLEGGKPLAEVATELGLSTGQLSTWRTERLAAGSAEALATRRADDDIAVPEGLLDESLYLYREADLKIFMPAHCFRSYTSFEITRPWWNTVARRTHFVECGPLTGFHKDTFERLLPFPSLRWGWGLDVHWSELARREGWNIGIIDSCPIRHLRSVATTYNDAPARAEALRFLHQQGITRPLQEILQTTEAF
jgi:transposase-like protein